MVYVPISWGGARGVNGASPMAVPDGSCLGSRDFLPSIVWSKYIDVCITQLRMAVLPLEEADGMADMVVQWCMSV